MVMRGGRAAPFPLDECLAESARIGVDAAGLLSWAEYKTRGPAHYRVTKRKQGLFREMTRGMELAGVNCGRQPVRVVRGA
jgi:hypothetical protein